MQALRPKRRIKVPTSFGLNGASLNCLSIYVPKALKTGKN
jgi:hypothetical protein